MSNFISRFIKINKLNNIDFYLCKSNRLQDIILLQEKVFNGLQDKDLLRYNNEETFKRCMKAPNFTIGAFYKNKLCAIIIFEDARGKEDDLGQYIDFNIGKYGDFKLILVDSKFRGIGLQLALMYELECLAFYRGYEYLITSVSPKNMYSEQNIIKSGYTYHSTNNLYNNLERKIYYKKITLD